MNAAIASKAGALLRTRAAFILTEDDCFAWFGVGRGTLERIGAGEVDPEPDVLQRIDRFLELAEGREPPGLGGGCNLHSPPPPGLTSAHGVGPLAGGGRNPPAGLFGGPV